MKLTYPRFFATAGASLRSILIASLLLFSMPFFLFVILAIPSDRLTLSFVFFVALITVLAGCGAAFLTWATIAEPLRRKRDKQEDVNRPNNRFP